ncbi:hypothetical protein Tco_1058996 [Tanacetum coccineum]
MTAVEISQTALKSEVSFLRQDTLDIKSMMVEIYQAFKGQPTLTPSGSVTLTIALTHIPVNVEEENATTTATEEPPSGETRDTTMAIPISSIHPTEVQPTHDQPITSVISHPESSQATPRIDKGKGIATESKEDLLKRLMPASTTVRPDPDALIPYTINEEPEVIKVVQEEAKKIGLDPRKIASAKACEKFKKAQDAKHQVLKREHTEKVRKSIKLRKHKFENYMWTINNRLKPETITDIKIHPKTKLVVITVYRGTDGRNFDVHRPFVFGVFSISELDKLREIIPKKKNTVVHDLMNSLIRRYERIRKIPEELGIKSTLPTPTPTPEQASSQSSRKKRKHMELEPETRIRGLECNRTLPKNVLFVNNMVIEEPEYEIFFTDEFRDQAFQIWSDIDKVGMEALVSYLVASSMVKSPENARFSLKLKKLITEHPDQEKLKSKKVKLEALGYEMN